MMECIHKYVRIFMCVGRKHCPFGNERNTICCCLTSILCRSHILEDKDCPRPLGQKQYNKLGKTVSLMLRICRPIFGSGKAVGLGSGFFVTKGITYIEAKGVYAESLIKKWHYWYKLVPDELIDTYF